MTATLKKKLRTECGQKIEAGAICPVRLVTNNYGDKSEFVYILEIDNKEIYANIKDIELNK
jgi:hypothetical protein